MIVNISTRSDSDFVRAFIYQTVAGAPINLTGSSLHLMARKRVTDAEVSLDISVANGMITITDAVNGEFSIRMPHEVLQHLTAGTYQQSLIRTRPDTLLEEIWHGTLTHEIGPTR